MRKMFSEKQIEALARQIAKEVVESTPKGYDIDNITFGSDLVTPEDLEEGKLPHESIATPTESQVNITFNSIKEAIKRGYIDLENDERLLLTEFIYIENEFIKAMFGNIEANEQNSTSYYIDIDFSDENKPIRVSYYEV